MKFSIDLLLHDIRSAHNVGAIIRTSECFGIRRIYLTGHSPYPKVKGDIRLPHEIQTQTKQISKTALGAEAIVDIRRYETYQEVLALARDDELQIIGLEQSDKSIELSDFQPAANILLVVGREVEGIEQDLIDKCSQLVEIRQYGQKESLNVASAAAIALYHLSKR